MFHEINQDKIDRVRGFDITVVTSAKTDDEGRALLRHLGFPFRTRRRPGSDRSRPARASDPDAPVIEGRLSCNGSRNLMNEGNNP